MAGEIFGNFPKGYMDRIKEAVRDTLRGDGFINGWAEGRIYLSTYSRVEKIRDVLPLALPAILVMGVSDEWTPDVGSSQRLRIPIGITLVWQQTEDVDVEDFGISHSSALNWIARKLAANPDLQVPEDTGPRLTDRFVGFETTSLEYDTEAEFKGDDFVGISSIVHLDSVAFYEAQIDYKTWTLITG